MNTHSPRFLLRRTAARALATPSKAFFAQPRSITTFTPAALRIKQQQQLTTSYFQRRFASDDVVTKTAEPAVEEAAEGKEAEGFAQTATEAPIDEDLTPAAQSETVGMEALEAATQGRTERKGGLRAEPATPGKTLYVGNLYYEVTEEQLKRVFSRFGTVDSVKVVFDNRGMSRGYVN
jgi:nucleolin